MIHLIHTHLRLVALTHTHTHTRTHTQSKHTHRKTLMHLFVAVRSIIRLHYRRRSIITFNLLTNSYCWHFPPLPLRTAHRSPLTACRAQLSSIANLSVAFATKRIAEMFAFTADAHNGLHFRLFGCLLWHRWRCVCAIDYKLGSVGVRLSFTCLLS